MTHAVRSIASAVSLALLATLFVGCMRSGVTDTGLEPSVSKQQTFSYGQDIKLFGLLHAFI